MPEPRWYEMCGRAAQVTGVLARHTLATVPVVARTAPRGGTAVRTALRDRLRALVCGLGASYIKGAQLLSTRHDLLPAAVCETLGQLHDRVPAMSTEQARAAVTSAFTGRDWPFAEFDWTPIASGSIACVYRATLHDGRAVAVKVRRPGIGSRMRADFALLAAGARLVQRLPGMRRLPASEMVGQISAAVLRQLDFTAEAESLRMLAGNLGDLDFLRVPAPVDEIRADGILVMEFIPELRRVSGGELPAETAALAVRRVLHCVYRMLFLDGLVHCDLHPGNLYLDLHGEVVLLDAGFVVHLKPRVRRLFAEFFFNMSRGNGRQCADIVVRSTDNGGSGADLERFRTEIVELVSATHNKAAGEFQLAPFAAKLFDLQRRCGLYAAPEFVFPLLSLLVIEGMINEFDAGVDFQAEAKPVLIKSLLTAVPREPAAG